MTRIGTLVVIAAALVACGGDSGGAAVETVARVVTVRALVDEEMRARPGWEADIRRTFAAASDVFEQVAQIRFAVLETVPWETDDLAEDVESILRSIRGVEPGRAELTVGFTGQRGVDDAPGQRYVHGGMAYAYGRHLVVGGRSPQVLLHELGHAFGAWHTKDPETLMYPVHRSIEPRYGPTTRAVLRLQRDYDFRAGITSISDATLLALADLYRRDHHESSPFPFTAHLFHIAESAGESDPETGRVLTRRANEIEERLGLAGEQADIRRRWAAERAQLAELSRKLEALLTKQIRLLEERGEAGSEEATEARRELDEVRHARETQPK